MKLYGWLQDVWNNLSMVLAQDDSGHLHVAQNKMVPVSRTGVKLTAGTLNITVASTNNRAIAIARQFSY